MLAEQSVPIQLCICVFVYPRANSMDIKYRARSIKLGTEVDLGISTCHCSSGAERSKVEVTGSKSVKISFGHKFCQWICLHLG